MHAYGFQYTSGRHTTWAGSDTIAGLAHRFASVEARDEWLNERSQLLREAITVRALPDGHSVYGSSADYIDHGADGSVERV